MASFLHTLFPTSFRLENLVYELCTCINTMEVHCSALAIVSTLVSRSVHVVVSYWSISIPEEYYHCVFSCSKKILKLLQLLARPDWLFVFLAITLMHICQDIFTPYLSLGKLVCATEESVLQSGCVHPIIYCCILDMYMELATSASLKMGATKWT